MFSYHSLMSVYLFNNKMTDEYWFTKGLYMKHRILSYRKIVIAIKSLYKKIFIIYFQNSFFSYRCTRIVSFPFWCMRYLSSFLVLFQFAACVCFIIRIYLFVGYFYRRNNLTITFLKRIYSYWRDDSYASKNNKNALSPSNEKYYTRICSKYKSKFLEIFIIKIIEMIKIYI